MQVEWVIEELKRIPPDCAVMVADSDIIFQVHTKTVV
jgi:hypothetical protein